MRYILFGVWLFGAGKRAGIEGHPRVSVKEKCRAQGDIMPESGQNGKILWGRHVAKAYAVPKHKILIINATLLRHICGQAFIFGRKVWVKAGRPVIAHCGRMADNHFILRNTIHLLGR